ncbi:putative homogentisate 1,2-dioxygenase [Seiridium cardinale]|uniref:homogentisate 1,2-dioxygenase n=1 Tax=Seiridium cardinale TaxID=138064 RepID=A0ABR2X9Y4_9PEZI
MFAILITSFKSQEKYEYPNGFDSRLMDKRSETIARAFPIGTNSPQKAPLGLDAGKLSGTVFTAPRHENLQRFCYRIPPSAAHSAYEIYQEDGKTSSPVPDNSNKELHQIPSQLRWDPFDFRDDTDWIQGHKLVGGAGSPVTKNGIGVFLFAAGKAMDPIARAGPYRVRLSCKCPGFLSTHRSIR